MSDDKKPNAETKDAKPKHLEKLDQYLKEQTDKVTIDVVDVQGAFVSQAPSYLAASIRHHKAQEVLQRQKQNYEKVTADVDFELRQGGEKTTEAYLAQAVKRDERVQKAKNLVIQAEYQASCYQSVVRAWEQKKDMLIQVGSDQRREYNSQATVNKPANRDGSVRARTVNGRDAEL